MFQSCPQIALSIEMLFTITILLHACSRYCTFSLKHCGIFRLKRCLEGTTNLEWHGFVVALTNLDDHMIEYIFCPIGLLHVHSIGRRCLPVLTMDKMFLGSCVNGNSCLDVLCTFLTNQCFSYSAFKQDHQCGHELPNLHILGQTLCLT